MSPWDDLSLIVASVLLVTVAFGTETASPSRGEHRDEGEADGMMDALEEHTEQFLLSESLDSLRRSLSTVSCVLICPISEHRSFSKSRISPNFLSRVVKYFLF